MKTRLGLFALIGALGLASGAGAIAFNAPETVEVSASWDYTSAINHYNNGNKDSLFSNLRGKLSAAEAGTSYDGLWDTYKTVYLKDDGHIKDYYSNATSFLPGDQGSGSSEGDTYNREHSIPKSWWGGSKKDQGCDPFIVIPADCHINSIRGNYPFGEVGSIETQSKNGYSKRGTSVSGSGYSGIVFEPNNEVKGDLARIVFYAITKYQGAYGWTSGNGGSTFSGNESKNFGLTDYAVKLLTKWHNLDKPDAWEKTVNDRLEGKTTLRNPFIDHPEFVSLLWDSGTHYVPGEGEDIPVGYITLDVSSFSGKPGDTFKIAANSSSDNSIDWSKNSAAVGLSKTKTLSGEKITVSCETEGSAIIYASTVIEGKTLKATCVVDVFTPLDSLRLEGVPVFTEYWDGDDFNPTGIRVFAVYGDKETDVTDNVVWEDLEPGDTEVTGRYGNQAVKVPGIIVFADSSEPSTGETVTLEGSDFDAVSEDTSVQTITKAGISFKGKMKRLPNTQTLYFPKADGFFCNTTNLGSITRVAIKYASSGADEAIQHFNFSSSKIDSYSKDAVNGGMLSSSKGGQTGGYSPTGTGPYGFFNISASNKNLQITSITIETAATGDAVTSFASGFLRSFTCDPTGATAPTFGDNISWSGLSSAFAFLTADEQAQFKNGVADPSGSVLGRCLARYDYLVGKYGYENFMDRNVQVLAAGHAFGLFGSSPGIDMIVAVILGASIAGVGGYLLIKKSSSKKRKD